MLIDTHCHLTFGEYERDVPEVLARARRAGIGAFVNVGVDPPSNRKAVDLAENQADVFAAVGLHPHSAHEAGEDFMDALRELADSSQKVVAIGETGLDYYKCPAPPQAQRRVFEAVLDLAGQAGLPAVVHSREAFADTYRLISEARKRHPGLRAVWHCFAYGPEELSKVAASGDLVSFTGIVTFLKAANLRECVRAVPEEGFMLESDAPYLAPEPHRGRRNEPAYLTFTAETISALRSVSREKLESATSKAALDFFGISLARCGR